MRIPGSSHPGGPGSRRSLGAAGILASAFLAAGCDLFQTREFAPRPTAIRAFSGSLTRTDTLAFRVTETLAEPGSADSGSLLARRILRFAKAPDADQPGGGWTAVHYRVVSEPPGSYEDEGLCYLRFDADGLTLKGPDSSSAGGGTPYFPLKRAASPAPAAGPAAADSGEFLALPPVFTAGAEWIQAQGPLEVARAIEETDTLRYGGRLEEAWRVAETVSEGGRALARGTYWYGASGLLQGEQAWAFESRAADGSPVGAMELRRRVVRL